MPRTYTPTDYTIGAYRLYTVHHRQGYAVRHEPTRRFVPNLDGGRDAPTLLPLAGALGLMQRLARDDRGVAETR